MSANEKIELTKRLKDQNNKTTGYKDNKEGNFDEDIALLDDKPELMKKSQLLKKERYIFGIHVKSETTKWNLVAILSSSFVSMFTNTYLNS